MLEFALCWRWVCYFSPFSLQKSLATSLEREKISRQKGVCMCVCGFEIEEMNCELCEVNMSDMRERYEEIDGKN